MPCRERTELDTSVGEQHRSHVVTAPFLRASASPELLLSMRDDDFVGVETPSRRTGSDHPLESRFATVDGLFVVSLLDDFGHPLHERGDIIDPVKHDHDRGLAPVRAASPPSASRRSLPGRFADPHPRGADRRRFAPAEARR